MPTPIRPVSNSFEEISDTIRGVHADVRRDILAGGDLRWARASSEITMVIDDLMQAIQSQVSLAVK